MSWAALLLAAAPLFEIELRWVEQPLVPAGVLSSAGQPGALATARGHGVTALGPRLRVASGSRVAWSQQLPNAAGLLLARQGRAQALLPLQTPGASWQFEALPQSQGQGRPLHLQLSWRQGLADGSTRGGQTGLTLAEGRWVSLLRDAPAAALPDQVLRSSPAGSGLVRELQVRVSRVPDEE